jgi:hypothetical protein
MSTCNDTDGNVALSSSNQTLEQLRAELVRIRKEINLVESNHIRKETDRRYILSLCVATAALVEVAVPSTRGVSRKIYEHLTTDRADLIESLVEEVYRRCALQPTDRLVSTSSTDSDRHM